MQIRFRKILYTALLLLGFCNLAIGQYTIPEKPAVTSEQKGVYDYFNLLSESQEHALDQKLIKYADTTSTQIVVAVIGTTKDEDISLLGAQWGQKWGIGQAKEDNGILIILAKEDRKVDINTGYGIESIISDRDAKRVIERIMIPQFKKGNYYAGLEQGTDALIQMLEGTFEGTPSSNKNNSSSIGRFILLFVIFMVIMILLSRGNRGNNDNGRRRKAESLLDVIILSNMGRGSWGSGSGWGSNSGSSSWGGGGGFGGGFGGGGFGGGGASGGW